MVKCMEKGHFLRVFRTIQHMFTKIKAGSVTKTGLAHPTSKANGDRSRKPVRGRGRLAYEPPANGLRIATAKCPTNLHVRLTSPKMCMAHTRKKAGRESTTGSASPNLSAALTGLKSF